MESRFLRRSPRFFLSRGSLEISPLLISCLVCHVRRGMDSWRVQSFFSTDDYSMSPRLCGGSVPSGRHRTSNGETFFFFFFQMNFSCEKRRPMRTITIATTENVTEMAVAATGKAVCFSFVRAPTFVRYKRTKKNLSCLSAICTFFSSGFSN